MAKVYGYCRISRKEQSIQRQIQNIKAAYPSAIIKQEAFTGTKLEGRKVFEGLIKTATKQAAQGEDITIVFDSVSRMSRNAADGAETYFRLYEAGITIVFLKEPGINTAVYAEAMNRQKLPPPPVDGTDEGELIDGIMRVVIDYQRKLCRRQIVLAFEQAQKEVDDLHERTREGLREKQRRNAELIAEYGEDEARQHPEWRQIGNEQGQTYKTKKGEAVKAAIMKYHKDFGTGKLNTLNDLETIKQAGCSRHTYYKHKRELLQEMQGDQ